MIMQLLISPIWKISGLKCFEVFAHAPSDGKESIAGFLHDAEKAEVRQHPHSRFLRAFCYPVIAVLRVITGDASSMDAPVSMATPGVWTTPIGSPSNM